MFERFRFPWVRNELDDWLTAARIDRGRLFRRVNKVGRAWGDGMTVKAVWHIVKESAKSIRVRNWRRTIYDGPVLVSATPLEASWIRSNFSWGTFRCKRLNATMCSGTLCRVAAVSACRSIHSCWITAH